MELLYKNLCNKKSDIHQHLPTLKEYSSKCDTVTEFGVRRGVSTCALLLGKPKKLTCYDINKHSKLPLDKYKQFSIQNNIDFSFNLTDVLLTKIEETELLFIDTFHTYTQLSRELYLHGGMVSKYIIFHDTFTFGEVGEDNKSPGLSKAITEFLDINLDWWIKKIYKHNNGLTIISKKKENDFESIWI